MGLGASLGGVRHSVVKYVNYLKGGCNYRSPKYRVRLAKGLSEVHDLHGPCMRLSVSALRSPKARSILSRHPQAPGRSGS
jgi:hypothetical protein